MKSTCSAVTSTSEAIRHVGSILPFKLNSTRMKTRCSCAKQLVQRGYGRMLLFIVAAGSSAVLVSCSSATADQTPEAPYVRVEPVSVESTSLPLEISGVIKEKQEVMLSFKVGGPILSLSVKEGDLVKKGEVIAQIDPRDYEIHLQAAKAQYDQITDEYGRNRQLFEQGKLPANTFEKLKAAYLATKSSFEAAQNALSDTRLVAPFTGYIFQKEVDPFETVNPGQPIVSLIDVSQVEVTFGLAESQIKDASSFGRIVCDVPNANAFSLPASIVSVSRKAGASNLFEVKLALANPNGTLRPGLSATVRIQLPSQSGSQVQVPVSAVFSRNGQSNVWVYNPTTQVVACRAIALEANGRDGMLLVRHGLVAGESIVIAGVNKLTDNEKVRVLNPNSI